MDASLFATPANVVRSNKPKVITKPRSSILDLFDPLNSCSGSESLPRSPSSGSEDGNSDKENDTPVAIRHADKSANKSITPYALKPPRLRHTVKLVDVTMADQDVEIDADDEQDDENGPVRRPADLAERSSRRVFADLVPGDVPEPTRRISTLPHQSEPLLDLGAGIPPLATSPSCPTLSSPDRTRQSYSHSRSSSHGLVFNSPTRAPANAPLASIINSINFSSHPSPLRKAHRFSSSSSSESGSPAWRMSKHSRPRTPDSSIGQEVETAGDSHHNEEDIAITSENTKAGKGDASRKGKTINDGLRFSTSSDDGDNQDDTDALSHDASFLRAEREAEANSDIICDGADSSELPGRKDMELRRRSGTNGVYTQDQEKDDDTEAMVLDQEDDPEQLWASHDKRGIKDCTKNGEADTLGRRLETHRSYSVGRAATSEQYSTIKDSSTEDLIRHPANLQSTTEENSSCLSTLNRAAELPFAVTKEGVATTSSGVAEAVAEKSLPHASFKDLPISSPIVDFSGASAKIVAPSTAGRTTEDMDDGPRSLVIPVSVEAPSPPVNTSALPSSLPGSYAPEGASLACTHADFGDSFIFCTGIPDASFDLLHGTLNTSMLNTSMSFMDREPPLNALPPAFSKKRTSLHKRYSGDISQEARLNGTIMDARTDDPTTEASPSDDAGSGMDVDPGTSVGNLRAVLTDAHSALNSIPPTAAVPDDRSDTDAVATAAVPSHPSEQAQSEHAPAMKPKPRSTIRKSFVPPRISALNIVKRPVAVDAAANASTARRSSLAQVLATTTARRISVSARGPMATTGTTRRPSAAQAPAERARAPAGVTATRRTSVAPVDGQAKSTTARTASTTVGRRASIAPVPIAPIPKTKSARRVSVSTAAIDASAPKAPASKPTLSRAPSVTRPSSSLINPRVPVTSRPTSATGRTADKPGTAVGLKPPSRGGLQRAVSASSLSSASSAGATVSTARTASTIGRSTVAGGARQSHAPLIFGGGGGSRSTAATSGTSRAGVPTVSSAVRTRSTLTSARRTVGGQE